MSFSRTINVSDMRQINLAAILELIRRESPISRTEIGERLNVSLPTVMRIVDTLIAEDLVLPNGESASGTGRGRRRSLLSFNPDGYVVIGVDLGGTKMYGAVSNLGGKILFEQTLEHHATSGEESYQHLVRLIESLVSRAANQNWRIRGLGVGAPGITLPDGTVTWAPGLNWWDFPLKARLLEDFKLPVVVENDVNLAVLGEHWFGEDTTAQNMVLIAVGTGIGAGIIIDGTLYRGAHQASGEVGYFLPGRDFLGGRYEGFGALESMASGTGIAERARQQLAGQWPPQALASLTAEAVFEAGRRGEAWAKAIIDETIDYLAIAIAGISVLLDPELIVLGGGVANAADVLIEPVLKRIEGAIPLKPRLVVSRLGHRAAVMGTIASVLYHTVDYYQVRKSS